MCSLRALNSHNRSHGFSLLELLLALIVGMTLTAMAVPLFNSAMTGARLNSAVNSIAGGIGKTRYRAIMKSQAYTLTLSTPANTYVVTGDAVPDSPVPVAGQDIAINGGANKDYVFVFCPNGTVWGGGACPPSGNAVPPALTATSQGRQINLSISSVGNVTTTTVH